jgi:hypothetical protein
MEEAQSYALTDDDIRKLLGGSIKITTYPDLEKMQHIDQLFDRHGRAILFVPQQNEQQGHWCCLIKRHKTIEFFDPYGDPPEGQKDTISEEQLARMKMNEPLLADLLTNNPYKVIFNKVQLQKLENDVNTCGRHCVARLLYHTHPVNKYREIIKRSQMSPDEFVVKLTYDDLGK